MLLLKRGTGRQAANGPRQTFRHLLDCGLSSLFWGFLKIGLAQEFAIFIRLILSPLSRQATLNDL